MLRNELFSRAEAKFVFRRRDKRTTFSLSRLSDRVAFARRTTFNVFQPNKFGSKVSSNRHRTRSKFARHQQDELHLRTNSFNFCSRNRKIDRTFSRRKIEPKFFDKNISFLSFSTGIDENSNSRQIYSC